MTSWIDERNRERRRELGISGPLSQERHAAINRRYPGLTREHCWICEAETGRAGRAEDSIYDLADEGPYCEDCYKTHLDRFEEPPESAPIETSGYYEVTGKEPIPCPPEGEK